MEGCPGKTPRKDTNWSGGRELPKSREKRKWQEDGTGKKVILLSRDNVSVGVGKGTVGKKTKPNPDEKAEPDHKKDEK